MSSESGSTMLWKDPSLKIACKGFRIDYSAIGKRYELVMEGDRAALDSLAIDISDLGDHTTMALKSVPGLSYAVAALIPDSVNARTPRLEYSGEGLLAKLTIQGEDGLLDAADTPDDRELSVPPPNTSFRMIYEPNDVDLKYGLPFRKGFKWDLTQLADDVVPITAGTYTNVADLLDRLNIDPTQVDLIAVINEYENGALAEADRGVLFNYLNAPDSATVGGTGINTARRWLLRYLRGQTNYRFWIPNITVTRRWRQAPTLWQTGDVNVPGEPGGPPLWTGAPAALVVKDVTGAEEFNEAYYYWHGAVQVDFAGDFWVTEDQWHGFLDFDADIPSITSDDQHGLYGLNVKATE